VGSVDATAKEQAVIADGGLQGVGYGWSNLQPTNCKIGAIRAQNCQIGLHIRSFNIPQVGCGRQCNKELYNVGLVLDKITSLQCRSGITVNDISGLHIRQANIFNGEVHIKNVNDCKFNIISIVGIGSVDIDAGARKQIDSLLINNSRN
jgi:hypothetical protein